MAIRSSSGISLKSLTSNLASLDSQLQTIKANQEDADYADGLYTDEEYLRLLATRKANSKPVAAANIQIQIDNLRQNIARNNIKADIEDGKKSYVDLVAFEQGLLDGMQQGSQAYLAQRSRVDSANDEVINLARNVIKQQIQNNQTSPRALANFETQALSAYQEGTPAYQSQLMKAQDAARQADTFDFNKTKAIEDAKYALNIKKAKDANNIALVNKLTDEQTQAIMSRIQDHPEFFTDSAGNPNYNYVSAESKIYSLQNDAANFAVTAADKAAAEGRKAFNDFKKIQTSHYNSLNSTIDAKMAIIKSGGLLTKAQRDEIVSQLGEGGKDIVDELSKYTPEQAANALADLTAEKIKITQDYSKALNDMVAVAPDDATAVALQDQVKSFNTDLIGLNKQKSDLDQLVAGGKNIIKTYDPTNNVYMPTAFPKTDAQGNPDVSSIVGDKAAGFTGGYVEDANGNRYLMKSNNKVQSYENANGTIDQYVFENGELKARTIKSDGSDATTVAYKPITVKNQDGTVNADPIVSAVQAHPDLLNRLQIPIETQKQLGLVDANGNSTILTVSENPIGNNLKQQALPVNENGSANLMVSDLKVQNAKNAQEITGLNAQNQELSGTVNRITGENAGLSNQVQELQGAVGGKSTQISSLASRISQMQNERQQIQKTLDAAKIQNAATIKALADLGVNIQYQGDTPVWNVIQGTRAADILSGQAPAGVKINVVEPPTQNMSGVKQAESGNISGVVQPNNDNVKLIVR